MSEQKQPSQKSVLNISLYAVRFWSGMVLFFYLALHLANHSLGLISLDVMNSGGEWVKAFWRFLPLSIVLYAALAAHFTAALWRVYNRRTLKMPMREWAQLLLGLAIPPLMLAHVMGTRYAAEFYGVNDNHVYVVAATYVFAPFNGILNVTGLVAAWSHGCIGMHMWLRTKFFYKGNLQMLLGVLAALLPVLALTGFLSAGREVAIASQVAGWLEDFYVAIQIPDADGLASLRVNTNWVRDAFWASLIALLLIKLASLYLAHRDNPVLVEYLDGPTVRRPAGTTLLEMSRSAAVPHASVCGGRGRCSTCRVKILHADGEIEEASDAEKRVLKRVQAGDDIRLACQLRITGNMKVMRLLPSDTTMEEASQARPWATGEERNVAILFADIRDFTGTAETRLPFDVVYLINQFSREMGEAVALNNGRIDKFLGDGLMAIFGIDSDPKEASRDAMNAANEMLERLAKLNEKLKQDLPKPLRVGIGIHTGPVVLGDMGYGDSRGLTAIGDTVNTASRLEAETKQQKCLICVSKKTLNLADMVADETCSRRISVRGRNEKLDIFALDTLTIGQLMDGRNDNTTI